MPKKVTLENLTGIIKKRFDGVDKRFDGVDKRFDGVDKRFDGVDKKFAKLEKNVSALQRDVVGVKGELIDVKERMATKVEVNKLLVAIDAYMKQGEDYRQEMVALSYKVDRHEKWITQIADKLGIKLEY